MAVLHRFDCIVVCLAYKAGLSLTWSKIMKTAVFHDEAHTFCDKRSFLMVIVTLTFLGQFVKILVLIANEKMSIQLSS